MKKLTSLFALICASLMMFAADPILVTPAGVTENTDQHDEDITINGVRLQYNGGLRTTDFRVYANKTLTISMENNSELDKVLIGGTIKKDFTATASTGDITYESTGGADTKTFNSLESPAVKVENIGAKSVTISVTKQLQAKQIWVYAATGETTTISLEDVEVRIGKTANVKVTKDGASPITWSTADPAIATVANGVITGVAEGTTTVTAKVSETLSATANVTVLGAYVFPAEGSELTCAQVKEMAAEMNENDTTPSYTVVGYVIEAGAISRNQQTLWLDDNKGGQKVFQSFWGNCPMNDQNQPIAFAKDDKVKVTGRIFLFQGNPEIKNGTVVGVEGGTPYVEEVLTPSQAADLVKDFKWTSNSSYDKTDKAYTIEGWVVERTTDYSAQYKNQTFTMADTKDGDAKFTAFQVKGVDYNIEAGWKVRVSGAILMNYKGNTPESVSGAAVEIIDDGTSADAIEIVPASAGAVYDEDFETYTFTFTAADGKAVSLTAAAKQHTRLVGEYTKTGNNKASVTDGTAADLASATLTIIYKGQNADEKPLYEVTFSGKTAANKEYVIKHKEVIIPATEGGQAVAIEERYWASEARAIAEKLNDGEKTTDTYVLLGFVTEIVTAYGTDAKYPKQQSFWIADTKDGGQVFQVYGAVGLDKTVQLGAKVEISATTLQNYKGTYETNYNSTIRVLAEGDECTAEEGYITIGQAIEIANKLEKGAKSETNYKIRAKISKVNTTQEKYDEFEAEKKNINITISDCSGAIDCFYTNDKDNKPFTCAYSELPKVGDEVVIEGPLKLYVKKDQSGNEIGTVPEFENAWFVEYNGGSAVENIYIELNPNAPMYNVLGIQVGKDYKGIVIQNGQKYLLR